MDKCTANSKKALRERVKKTGSPTDRKRNALGLN